MNRLFKLTALFATVVSLSVFASPVEANGRPGQNNNTGGTHGTPPVSTTWNATSIFGGTIKNASGTTPAIHRFPTNTRVIFNQPTKPTFPYRVPPGGWKYYGGLFGKNPPPTTTPQPTKGSGMGHGFGGGSFSGGTVVSTTVPVATPAAPADSTPSAPADSDAANAMQIAAGSTFTLKGEKFGDKAGQIGVVVGEILIPVQVIDWSDKAITLTLPQVGVGSAAKATFLVQRADGSTTKETSFAMVAAK